MNLFELYAKLSLNSEDYDKGLDEAEGKAQGFGPRLASALGGAVGAVGTATVAAVGAAATAAGAIVKQAVDSYSEYEQLVGGVETLFKDSSDTVIQNAQRAYQTAGLSANQYMQTVTSFSAALIQSTGRGAQQDLEALEKSLEEQYTAEKRHWEDRIALVKDSTQKTSMKRQMEDELKALKEHNKEVLAEAEAMNNQSVTTTESLAAAAEAADRAMIDMSDNANKMGTQMDSLMMAYQGFSKQNYTMLDNLKLGYGGTKEEMERLIQDASKLTDVQAELGLTVDANSMSFANIVNAISVVQKSMGIAGTTAEEAERTISGSMNAVKAAWQNLLTAMAGGGPSIEQAIADFTTSAEKFLNNMIPVFQQAMMGLAQIVTNIAPILAEMIPELLNQVVPMFLDAVMQIVDALIQSLPTLAQTIVQAVIGILPDLITAFIDILSSLLTTILPAIFDLAIQLVIALGEGLAENADKLIEGIVTLITYIVDVFLENLPKILEVGMNLLLAIVEGLLFNMQPLMDAIVNIVGTIISTIIQNLPMFLELGAKILGEIALGIVMAIPMLAVSLLRVLGIVEDTKNDVGRGAQEMQSIADGTNNYVGNSMSQLNNMMSQTTSSFQQSAQKINDLSKDTSDKTADIAYDIRRYAETLGRDVKQFISEYVLNQFNMAMDKVREFRETLNKNIGYMIEDFDRLGQIIASPSVNPAGVEKGCAAIISAVNDAIDALASLDRAGGGAGDGGFGGGRASGGWMRAGTSYLVGEQGPELITATRGGYVHNASETAGMYNQQPQQIVINVNGDVYDDARSMERKLKRAVLSVIEEQVVYG